MTPNLPALIGALTVSTAGSVPMHLLPIIIATVIADGRASLATAGWAGMALLLGQLSASLALPGAGITTLRRGHVLALGALLLPALALSAGGLAWFLIGWFLVGLCCGSYQYLGIVTAAAYPRKRFAFGLRLGLVLCLSGTVVALLQAGGSLGSYLGLVAALGALLAALVLTGTALMAPVTASEPVGRPPGGTWRDSGLLVVLLLFVGQTGFLAYVVQTAGERGLPVAETIWAFAAVKIAAGLLLLVAVPAMRETSAPRFVALGTTLAGCIVAVSWLRDVFGFFVALLVFELAFNLVSARFQAHIAQIRPASAGWLTAAILLGAALGPALHGAALAHGAGTVFLGGAILSALLPAVWSRPARPILATGCPMHRSDGAAGRAGAGETDRSHSGRGP